jgi:glycosyltransferase involved in cell wall biosynthesis
LIRSLVNLKIGVLPVAAGVRELVGEAGIIVPPMKPGSLAGAMLTTMQHTEEERQKIGQKGRARIAASFSLEAKADEWEAIYRSNLSK